MKKNILMVLGVALVGLPLLAADFSGSWLQDPKSDRVPEPMWLTRAVPNARGGRAGGPGGRGNPGEVLQITQDATMVQVSEPQGAVRKYKLDGSPATSNTETGMQKSTVSATMQGDTLVITTSRPYGGMPGNVTLNIKEVWSLSPDGKVLTMTTTHKSPAVEKTFRQTYNRR